MAYVPHAEIGYLHSTAEDLDRKLREGDGLLWPGDPRLSLGVGVIEDRHKRKIVARRYEVWRHNEDGSDAMIGHWLLEEYDRILFDLVRMRVEAPGHEDVVVSIDKANAITEAKNSQEIRDHLGEAMEHGAKLFHDRTEPKNVFRQMPGTRDIEKPTVPSSTEVVDS